ncbi:hypothetical protein [Nocardia sp. NPDC057440]
MASVPKTIATALVSRFSRSGDKVPGSGAKATRAMCSGVLPRVGTAPPPA